MFVTEASIAFFERMSLAIVIGFIVKSHLLGDDIWCPQHNAEATENAFSVFRNGFGCYVVLCSLILGGLLIKD